MRQLTAIVHHGDPDEGGFRATGLEVPEANGQGDTQEECLRSLADAVRWLVELEREQVLKDDPAAQEVPIAV